ncbi:MAG TPA: CAP domain-containing protein [Oligoflexus sp.]|uniref:CAP domain-containing protein n=1 Tax=Oligoflexus sp. TaxID=1971216 RepID=UPI002D4EB3DB|nr:CAP domain-containing protein [Oligoflexus sp.]HYX34877.1 CAP domain-containing protein [Oligoflexus sp.]
MKRVVIGSAVLALFLSSCRDRNSDKDVDFLGEDGRNREIVRLTQDEGEGPDITFFIKIDAVDSQGNRINNAFNKVLAETPFIVDTEFTVGTRLAIQVTKQEGDQKKLATKNCSEEQRPLHTVQVDPGRNNTFKVHLCSAISSSENDELSETVEVTVQVKSDTAGRGSTPDVQPTTEPQPQGPTSCYKADPLSCEAEAKIVDLLNQKRKAANLAPIKLSLEGSFVARKWSKSQAAAETISHAGFPSERQDVLNAEFPASSVRFTAENVASYSALRAETTSEIANTLFTLWWNSSGHRNNMMGAYRFIGMGLHVKTNSSSQLEYYGTQLFHN